ncbi:MAG: 2-C-methyl-D-erythritol 4-phosphate cytidylyltransferase [Desulfobulbaceae bacterium]|nr:2-C-methyl-D-erythritol 4-phosphate cytidylyltransferase [Desulfobulbaceae bacterium]MCK5544478.1 2-C-methyl-D-erythritol 4-phosphate cytidylyltransferase [Desulfobulbaceae bacterium]
MSNSIAAIIPAGGIGRRMGLPVPKQFIELSGIPILVRTIRVLNQVESIREIVLAVPDDHIHQSREMVERFGFDQVVRVVPGGATRQDSVLSGLESLSSDIELVVVHDGVRPFVKSDLIAACIEVAERDGAAIAAIPVKDTLKAVSKGNKIDETVSRIGLWQAQTPQVARVSLLRAAFAAVKRDGFIGTDEASLLEHIGCTVTIVEGARENIKITHPDDLSVAEALLMRDNLKEGAGRHDHRIGHGYDAHRLVPDRPLILGGVRIPHSMGLEGHSDADVLTHALCDALLGSVGAGDIGRHFPDTDDRYKGIDSLKLLSEVVRIAAEVGFMLENGDITVVAQKPRLSPFFDQMRENLAQTCRVGIKAINIKATTTEKMGFVGREEGICAHAVVLVRRVQFASKLAPTNKS